MPVGHDLMQRHELIDKEWDLLAPLILFCRNWLTRVDDRRVNNGKVYKIRTGMPWCDLPLR